jgi:RNA polymerase sigma-70 factor (ECF subfamily)
MQESNRAVSYAARRAAAPPVPARPGTPRLPAPRATVPTDEALVASVLTGQDDRFADLVARYEKPIINFIYRMIGDYEQSLDLAQEVFFKAYRSLSRFDPAYRFSTWLYRIASNRTIDHLRKRSPAVFSLDQPHDDGRPDGGASQVRSNGRGPEDLLASRELGERIALAIDALPPAYRELILLRHQQGIAYDAIARLKRLPLGTVKNRLFRAREILKKRLGA